MLGRTACTVLISISRHRNVASSLRSVLMDDTNDISLPAELVARLSGMGELDWNRRITGVPTASAKYVFTHPMPLDQDDKRHEMVAQLTLFRISYLSTSLSHMIKGFESTPPTAEVAAPFRATER